MITINSYDVFIASVNLVHILAVLRLHEIISFSYYKEGWNKASLNMIYRV
jgi:hypothetical protein